MGPADANNHLAWGYSVGDDPYEFDVKTIYAYDHPFFVITVQNDYPGDCVYVYKNTCKPETDKAVAATCTKSGLTEGSHCKYCKKVLTAQKATPATGHRYIPSEESYASPEATLSKDGRLVSPQVCTNCDNEYEKTAVIPKVSTVKLSKTAYTYNGKVQRPGVVVKDRTGKALKGGVDYNVSDPKGMKNVGKYTVKVTFKENYSGSKSLTYTINPKGTGVSKVTAAKKGFKVTWKKQKTQTTGYQVQYSTDKNFKKNNKTVTISKNITTSKSVGKLKAKKKYYVRVRTYKTVKFGGKSVKLYSGWSKAKSVTTKK